MEVTRGAVIDIDMGTDLTGSRCATGVPGREVAQLRERGPFFSIGVDLNVGNASTGVGKADDAAAPIGR